MSLARLATEVPSPAAYWSHHARALRVCVGASLVLAAPSVRVAAQVPSQLQFRPSAAISAMGGAGAGRGGNAGAAILNPAVYAWLPSAAVEVSVVQIRSIDVTGVDLVVATPGPLGVRYGLELRNKGVTDLIEDPEIDDQGLSAGDLALRITAARSLGGGRIGVGATVTRVWSTVIATEGRTMAIDVGAIARLHRRAAVAASLRRLGPASSWSGPGIPEFKVGLEPGVRLGASLEPVSSAGVSVAVAADAEYGRDGANQDVGIGAQVSLVGDAISFRGGWSRAAEAVGAWSGGVGFAIGGVRFAVAYTDLAVVGSVLQFSLGLGRSADAHPSGGHHEE